MLFFNQELQKKDSIFFFCLVFDVDAVVVVVVVAYPKRPWDVWCNMKPEDGWKKRRTASILLRVNAWNTDLHHIFRVSGSCEIVTLEYWKSLNYYNINIFHYLMILVKEKANIAKKCYSVFHRFRQAKFAYNLAYLV